MKRLSTLLLFVLLALTLSACAQGVQGVVELPSPLQVAILSAVTFVVGLVFAKIAEAIPFLRDFLQSYIDEVSFAVAGAVVMGIQNILNAIPPEWEGAANAFLVFLVAVLAALQVLKLSRKVAKSLK